MANTATWADPDTTHTNQGGNAMPGVVYVIDPTSGHAVSISGIASITNDGTFIKPPTTTATQAANTAGNVVVKASAGALYSATITATGTAGLNIYDNASTNSGTILLAIPANATVGTIYSFPAGQPAANGIVSNGVANCPAVTFAYR